MGNPADDAGGLEAVLCLTTSARVMFTSNLWGDVGPVNGAFKLSATALELHLICQLLSWYALIDTRVLFYMTAPYPSLHSAAPGLHLESSAHVYSSL